MMTSRQMFLLLGIHFAQFPEMWEDTSKGKLRHNESHEPLLTDGKYIKGLSGMTCVLPAWSIIDVLNMPILRKMRGEAEVNRQEYYSKHGFPPHVEDTRFAAPDPTFLSARRRRVSLGWADIISFTDSAAAITRSTGLRARLCAKRFSRHAMHKLSS
jgi:hypothetical protein